MSQCSIVYGVDGRKAYALGPLDENALFRFGADIDRLLPMAMQHRKGFLTSGDLKHLPLVDYELIMAHFYSANFGRTVGQNIDCAKCRKKYAFEFSLPTFAGLIRDEVEADPEQVFEGVPYRFPTLALLADGPRDPGALALALWQGDGDLTGARRDAFEAHLARACPPLQETLEAPCPACGEVQRRRFRLRQHLGVRLLSRLRALLQQIHILAASYHWSPGEILALPHQSRVLLVDTIRTQANRSRARSAI